METMEHELKFLNMLGYKIAPLYENRWNILDESNNVVGFIQIKKIISKNKKNGTPARFGYVTEIDNDVISYKNIRPFDDESNMFSYNFDVKRGNGTDYVEMNCGQFPTITMWSKEHGYMQFRIENGSLFVNFMSKTENFNTEELVIFKWNMHNEMNANYKEKYVYQIDYCDKHIELNDSNSKGRTARAISAEDNEDYQEHGQIELEEKTWINSKLRTNRKSKCVGTVEEVIQKHQMGINAISHFRYLLNDILPFKQEILSAMLENYELEENKLALFLPDIVEQKQKAKGHQLKK